MPSEQQQQQTASEEFDLLTKSLEKASSRHVRRIHQAHISSLEAALRKAWDWLNKYYASPEVIENALFKKTGYLPKDPQQKPYQT